MEIRLLEVPAMAQVRDSESGCRVERNKKLDFKCILKYNGRDCNVLDIAVKGREESKKTLDI